MATSSRALLYSSIWGAFAIATPAVAQASQATNDTAGTNPAPDNASDNHITDIIVTAQKRSESISKVPMSISAVSREQLADAGVQTIGDLTKVVPGFRYTQSSFSAPIYSIRGIGFNESSLGAKPNVSVYVDEIPFPVSVTTLPATLDLERVEVLKGPQGTLFGTNTTGGAINYIAAKPTRDFEAGADLSYSRFGLFQANGYVSGPITDTLSARVAVSTDQGGAWQKSYTRNDSLGNRNRVNGRALIDWKPSDAAKFELSYSHFEDRSDQQAAQAIAITPLNPKLAPTVIPLLLAYPLAPANDRAADWDAHVAFKDHNIQNQLALHADIGLGDHIKLTSLTSYLNYHENQNQDADGTALQNEEYRTLASIQSFNQELHLTGNAGNLIWLVGGSYEHTKVDEKDVGAVGYDTNSTPLGFGTYYNSSIQTFKSAGAFANLDYNIGTKLTAHAGARYTHTSDDFTGCTGDTGDGALAGFWNAAFGTAVAPGGCVTLSSSFQPELVSKNLTQHNISWRGGLDYKPDGKTLLYANISRGYKAGSFPILSSSQESQLTPVTQESILAYEAGFKATLADRTLQVSGAAFYYDYSNKQVRGRLIVPVFGPLEGLVNIPKSRVLGAELQMTWKPMRGLTATGGATYVSSKIRGNFSNYDAYGHIANFGGEAFPLTSKVQADADLSYEFAATSRINAFVGANLTYQSGTNGALGDLPILSIAPYALLDLRAGVKSADGAWKVSIWGRNVTNKYYWTIADHIADTTVRYAGMPATYGVTLSLRLK